ncbi:WD40-repeat-containing domain protein [Stachybotrys elegans]|uniref:WD40-repeat-containing domain protein n=1 Tax=Stachybotrys elegans TaxID=80388 RepID=A0A8K0WV74_9HYPO|nr:WD40-repeat-containing domain protein [Stachybotrys elegans]
MAKRKRQAAAAGEGAADTAPTKKSKAAVAKASNVPKIPETIQIVAGSYDRILHGVIASIDDKGEAEFADTFLFNAHATAIRCVAVSPPSAPVPGQTQKVFLASGSTDEKVNLYNLSAHPPSRKNQDLLASVAPRPILENSKNRELGTLQHHESTITALRFPTRSKLLSSSEDSTIAVTRTRDWSMLSAIKAPKPKPQGRPTGDTAAFGGTPSGVNDFAIHPSMKLMISVSKGERCMRLWNLVTGKKAGVLNFGRELLQEIGEGRHSTGEGRRVMWGNVDGADEFAVAFDREIVVFGMDSVPKCRVMGSTKTKVHQMSYLTLTEGEGPGTSVLAVATEDGRIAFFSTRASDLSKAESTEDKEPGLDIAKAIGHLGGKEDNVSGRIKDFVVLSSESNAGTIYVAGGSSDGKLRLWRVESKDLYAACERSSKQQQPDQQTVGKLLGTYETRNRITCMAAYLMIPRPEGVEDSEDEEEEEEEASDSDSGDDSGSDGGDA